MENADSKFFAIVNNIPRSLHTSDLRTFFTEFVETDKFSCFHYRHRPEVKVDRTEENDSSENEGRENVPRTSCCIVRFDNPDFLKDFVEMYNRRHWLDERGEDLPVRCFVSRIRVSDDDEPSDEPKLSKKDLSGLLELRPPPVMPRGNVGTSTSYFLKAIQECRLPAKLIGKLKLEFPRSRRRRKYGNVPLEYEDGPERSTVFLSRSVQATKDAAGPSTESAKDDSDADDDDDTCEEWERHEALNNDVSARRVDPTDISQQPGTKERLFEEEMEVTWDKGSSGLVFYTDAQFWKEKEGDFDEQTTDDWDVDMQGYYEEGTGDKDARDMLNMRTSDHFRQGKTDAPSVFRKPKAPKSKVSRSVLNGGGASNGKIGQFERHTKGFGRRIMEQQGWRDGQGLGSTYEGMADALESEGQVGKSGFGYRGEAIVPFVTQKKRKAQNDVIISTKYDDPDAIDPAEKIMRSNPQVYLSHRKFQKATYD